MLQLTQKYRPRKFQDVIGQPNVIEFLQELAQQEKQPNSIILEGSYGTGKTTLARIYANRLNCLKPKDNEPCGECPACQQFQDDQYMNAYYKEFDSSMVGDVAFMRDFVDMLGGNLLEGKYRIIVFDEAQEVSKQAQSVLLKLLEDAHNTKNIFIFCTTASYKLLDTIQSRSFSINFKTIPYQEIFDYLHKITDKENIKFDEVIYKIITLQAGGHVRNALMALDRAILTNVKTVQDYYEKVGVDLYLSTLQIFLKVSENNFEELHKQIQNLFRNTSIIIYRDIFYKVIELLIFNRARIVMQENDPFISYQTYLTKVNAGLDERKFLSFIAPFFTTMGLSAFYSEEIFETTVCYLTNKVNGGN